MKAAEREREALSGTYISKYICIYLDVYKYICSTLIYVYIRCTDTYKYNIQDLKQRLRPSWKEREK
jgi:hypothetical protein